MPNLKDIRKRISSVKNTQKITRAMKLVSAAKLRRAQQAVEALRPYSEKQRELLASLVTQLEGSAPRPLLAPREEISGRAFLILTSDRGMCGGFNNNLLRLMEMDLEESTLPTKVFSLGRRAAQHRKKRGYEGRDFGEILNPKQIELVREICDTLVGGFISGEFDEVLIYSNHFKNALTQIPGSRPLLPLSAEEPEEELGEMIYEPDLLSLLDYILPRYLEVQVLQTILESIAGEHGARMNAMNSATDNANDMISSLTLQMNRARQAAITTELMEVIGGAEALK